MEQDAYVPMSGHCIIGTATTVVETEMVPMVSPVTTVQFDTLAGQVTCFVEIADNQVSAVSFENVDSFLHSTNVSLDVDGIGEMSVDVAYVRTGPEGEECHHHLAEGPIADEEGRRTLDFTGGPGSAQRDAEQIQTDDQPVDEHGGSRALKRSWKE